MSEQTITLHRFAASPPDIRKHIFYGNILIWNTGFGRGSINTHQQQRWPCEDMGLSRVNQQNNRAGNRWSIFNIRMKIIKMFTMKINIVLAVRKSISAGKVKLKWPVRALLQQSPWWDWTLQTTVWGQIVADHPSSQIGEQRSLSLSNILHFTKYIFVPDFPILHICFDKVFMLILFDLWSKLSSF